jgi:hypothetical protein
MKRALVLVAVLLLPSSLAWAEAPAPEGDLFAAGGGGCMLPDLAGLSPDQIAAAALGAGFQVSPHNVDVPACPATFHCDSLTGCAAGPLCSITDIGQCCQAGDPVLCCLSGTIKVQRCRCECTGPVCSVLCASSTDVRWRCSP